jgi:putative membrane protein
VTLLGPLTAAVFAAAFVHAVVALRRRGRKDLAGWDRTALFVAALALWEIAFSSKVDALAERSLAAHMVEHVLIGDAVPALVLTAVRGPLLFFLLPVALLRPLARSRALRAFLAVLTRPTVAFLVWASALGVWHIPALYDATLDSVGLHVLEHATFILGGTLVWLQLVDPARRRALTPQLRLFYALAVFIGSMLLANVLILSYRPLYPAYAAQTDRPLGLSAFGDQGLAALIMLGEQFATLGTFGAVMLRRWLRAPAEARDERHPLAV